VGKHSLGATVALGFASLLVMLAALVALAIHEVKLAQDQRRAMAAALQAAEATDRLSLDVARSDAALRDFILSQAGVDRQNARAFREMARLAADSLQTEPWADSESRQLADGVVQAASVWVRQAEVAEGLAVGLRPENALAFHRQYLSTTVADLHERVETLRTRLQGSVDALRRQLNHRGDQLTMALIVGFGLAGVIGILLGVHFVRLVTDPVSRLVNLAEAVRAGDYATVRELVGGQQRPTERASNNEIDLLTETLAHMADTLEEREGRLRSHAENLAAMNQVLAALQSLTDAALSDLALEPLLAELLRRVVTGVSGDTGVLFLKNRVAGGLEPRITHPMAAESLSGDAEAIPSAFAEAVAAGELPTMVADLQQEPQWAHPFLTGRQVGAYLALPLQLGGDVFGVAYVEYRKPRCFEPAQTHLMEVFGERVERAVERARSLEEVAAWQRDLQRQVAQQEEQLVRSERLAAIGLVGGSIAHELRNPLGVISNSVYFLQHRSMPTDEKVRRHLEIIALELEQAKRIINNLVDFSTGIEPMTARLNLNTLIETALEAVRIPPQIALELELASPMPSVLGDESQLLQVFEHLIRNAIQAMETGGRLRVRTGASEARVWAVVSDTGHGIPKQDQQRIFEPLVSTRTKGMGLGLTLSRRIVEAHGGEIRLESESGNGATFTVELPVTERVAAPTAEPAPEQPASARGGPGG
jgi:signal transduction histidine kinase/HAMP domain-containing protein